MIGERLRNKEPQNGGLVRLADRAATEIREMIITDRLSPWELLSEVKLAKQLDISRTPIREAITQLEQEGLLRVVPGRGAFVVDLTNEDFREINTLRVVLEPLAAESAVRVIPDEAIEEQKGTWSRVAEDLAEHRPFSVDNLTDADDRLHWLFIDHCDNGRLRNFLSILRCQIARYVYISWNTRAYMEETVSQHLDVILALERRDIAELRIALERHITFNDKVFACRAR